jgi:hypothetical protein
LNIVTVLIPPDVKRFRMAILPLAINIFVAGFILGHGLGISLILIKHGFHIDWMFIVKIILLSILPMLAFAFIWALMMNLLYPSYVSSSGIYGHSILGARRYLNWTDMVQARKFRLGNSVYLRLYDNTGRAVIWLPLFQSPLVEFRNEIRKFAPPNSPILDHLS